MRDTAALPVDIYADPWGYGVSDNVQIAGTILRVVDQRAVILDASNLMEEAALDRYEFIRDGFLQSRKNKVFDGETSRKEAVKAAKADAADEAAADAPEPTAASIKAAYADDAPAPAAPAATAEKTTVPVKPTVKTPAVSSEPASK
jgi:phospholipid-binding lipoprotein MlaA